jgi:poly(hydroxyalkanoate) depolymerase family esterase
MTDTFKHLMREATRLTQAGLLNEATEAIQRALGGMSAAHFGAAHALTDHAAGRSIIDGEAFEVTGQAVDDARSRFIAGTFMHAGVGRDYKVYVPANPTGVARPLVVMLHGCTQNPDDFAAGTGMNALADELGFVVLYPAQSQAANPQGCWNWFEQTHQQRGAGEPAALAGMTQAVIREHGIDARRVFIAGLSAGGAMADIVGNAYPDIFAAVGVHSGLPCGSASSMSEAFSVMASGSPDGASPDRPLPGTADAIHFAARPSASARRTLPTIVFHGDNDRTVHPRNGEQVIAAALGRASGHSAKPRMRVHQGVSDRGRRYTRTTHDGQNGAPVAEHWLVHGAGHAWSGGQAGGSYTDVSGPDATREMLRFFLEQQIVPDA